MYMLRNMKGRFGYVVLALVSLMNQASIAFADVCKPDMNAVISNWSEAAEAVVRAKALKAPEAARLYALNSIALHDSYMISLSKDGYSIKSEAGSLGVSTEQFLANASYALINAEYPETKTLLDFFYSKQFCEQHSIDDKYAGANIGRQVSEWAPSLNHLETRGRRKGAIGVWVLTPPTYDSPVLPFWSLATPMELRAADQFRPDGPPNLSSEIYADALFQVKVIGKHGRQHKATKTAEIAQFWADGHRTATGPGHWNQIARQVTKGLETAEVLKILLAMNIAMYDAGIAAWDAKYSFEFWRPVTAIRMADIDGNKRTSKSDEWVSYLKSPYHPEYVSGHSTFSAAAATILETNLGEVDFCTRSEGISVDIKRCFNSFWEAAEEAGMSRVYGGIHFSFSNEDGLELGRKVGNWTIKRLDGKALSR